MTRIMIIPHINPQVRFCEEPSECLLTKRMRSMRVHCLRTSLSIDAECVPAWGAAAAGAHPPIGTLIRSGRTHWMPPAACSPTMWLVALRCGRALGSWYSALARRDRPCRGALFRQLCLPSSLLSCYGSSLLGAMGECMQGGCALLRRLVWSAEVSWGYYLWLQN